MFLFYVLFFNNPTRALRHSYYSRRVVEFVGFFNYVIWVYLYVNSVNGSGSIGQSEGIVSPSHRNIFARLVSTGNVKVFIYSIYSNLNRETGKVNRAQVTEGSLDTGR